MYQLEKKTRFSKSHIWQLQRDYFEDSGINAWRSGKVPHYITSNPVIGKTYAELVLAFLRDLALRGENSETVYLIELGAGHGRLCYHFFKHFERFYMESAIALPAFCYVLSDFTASNLEFWKEHPRLRPYLEKGWLDFALFDAEKTKELNLEHSKLQISPHSLAQPLIVLANYFFDTIPQDLFRIENQTISHCLLEISTEMNPENMQTDELIDALMLHYDYEECMPPIAPENQLIESLIDRYRILLSDTHLLFPMVGISCIERLLKLSKEGMLLLTADKGEHHLSNLDHRPAPGFSTHGSFSFIANYHALAEYCQQKNGISLFPKHQQSRLDLGCLLFVEEPDLYRETLHAYERFVQDFGPDDYFSLKKFSENHFMTLCIRDVLALVRLSAYDGRFFSQLLPRLLELVPTIEENDRWNILLAVTRIWDNYFPLGENCDLASELGELLYELDFFEEAILYFEKSQLIYGKNPDRQYKIALCYCLMGAVEHAEPILEELKAIHPENEALQKLIREFDLASTEKS